jgi:hypothetical protein
LIKENAKYISAKKSVHVNIGKDIHRKFRSQLFLQDITMQQFLENCIELFVNENARMNKIINDLKKELKEKELNKLRGIDKKDLYDVIEENSPFS